jgi:hypothetical protein
MVELLQPLVEFCGGGTKVVSVEDWLEKIKQLEFSSMIIRGVPLGSLVDMFTATLQGLRKYERRYEMKRGSVASSSLANVQSISKELLGMWIKKWNL